MDGQLDAVFPRELLATIDEVNETQSIPTCLKKLLTQITVQLSCLMKENAILRQENKIIPDLRKENDMLKEKLRRLESKSGSTSSLLSQSDAQPLNKSDCCEKERLRSVIIGNVPEQSQLSLRHRRNYDFNSVLNILDHLKIECHPVAVYRLGKPNQSRKRLLKVVLPSSFYQKLAVRRSSWLRTFPGKGLFLRESQTVQERLRRRERKSHVSFSSQGVSYAESASHCCQAESENISNVPSVEPSLN